MCLKPLMFYSVLLCGQPAILPGVHRHVLLTRVKIVPFEYQEDHYLYLLPGKSWLLRCGAYRYALFFDHPNSIAIH